MSSASQRHVRRLEHVAAGVEHEVRALARLRGRAVLQALVHVLAEPRKFALIKLHARENIHAIGNQPEVFDALLAPIAQLGGLLRQGDARHRQQEARIDAFVAGRDAVAGERATFRPGL